MIATKPILENKVTELNNWLQHHTEANITYLKKKQKRDYYVNKLCDMDDLGLTTIEI